MIRRCATLATMLAATEAHAGAIVRMGMAVRQSPIPSYSNTRTVVGTVTTQNGWAVIYSWQRKIFYANGLYWLFYGEGTATNNQVYRTSADGVTWSSATTVRTTTSFGAGLGHRIGYWLEAGTTSIHYAACDADNGDDLFYRKGTLNANGTITWAAAEQTVAAIDASHAGGYPKVFTDSTGMPWIGFMYAAAASWTAPYVSRVYKSSTSNGTWTTDTGFPFDLLTSSNMYNPPQAAVLTSGKMYWVYSCDTLDACKPNGRMWNGASWDTAEALTVSNSNYQLQYAAGDGAVVHVVFADPSGVVKYRRRSATGTWGSESTLGTQDTISNPSLVVIGTDQLRAYWPLSNKVYYSDIIGGEPRGGASVLQDESTPTLANTIGMNMMPVPNSDTMILVYTTKAASPFDIVALKQRRN